MSNARLNQLFERAQRMDDKDLGQTYKTCRDRVLNGRSIDDLNADESLRFTGALRQMLQDRSNGTSAQPEDIKTLAQRLSRDTGIAVEDALRYIQQKGDPYAKAERKLRGEPEAANTWDGMDRRGIRQPGFTAADLDDKDDRDFSQSEPEQRTVTRRYTWGE